MNYEREEEEGSDLPEEQSFRRWYNRATANDQTLPPKNKFLPRLSNHMTTSEDLLILLTEQGRQEEHPAVVYAYDRAFLRRHADDDPGQFEFDFREYR